MGQNATKDSTEMKKAIVTGASGFIGQALAKALRAQGVEVVEVDITLGHDLTVSAGGSTWNNADVVYHLAGCSDSHQDAAPCLRSNFLSTLNVLEAMLHLPGARLIYASTYLNDASAYATSKRCSERLLTAYRDKHGMPAVSVRCCNVYGPGDRNPQRLVPRLIRSMLSGETASVSRCKRDFVYIDDVVRAYVLLGRSESWTREMAISGTGLMPLAYLAEALSMITGANAGFEVRDCDGIDPTLDETGGLYLWAKGWTAKTPLVDGLSKTVDRWKSL
jgi:nucleoside-diphosphate-sugar epimerase